MQKNNKENNERKSEKKDIINNKIIHYCWFGGKPLSKLTQKCIKSWKKYLPDFEIKQWNETNVDLNECSFIKQAYEQKKWAFVADYTRFKALEQYGGLYLDTDMEITADISKYLQNDFFVGKEDSNMANAAVVWVKNKQDKHIKEILKIYKSYDKFNQTGDIYAVSVPRILSNYLEKYGFDRKNDNIQKLDDGTIYVYPMEYFYPLSYDYQHNKFTKNSCMIHHFDATWASGHEKMTLFLRRHKLTFLFSIWKFFSVVKYKIKRIIRRINMVKCKIKKLLNKKVYIKVISIIMILLFIFSIIPLLKIANYNYPLGDDYSYGLDTHNAWLNSGSLINFIKAAFHTVVSTYNGWQGTFVAVFLFAINISNINENLYFINSYILILTLIISTLYIGKVIFIDYFKTDKYVYFILTLVPLALSIQYLPSPAESFYWYNGSVYYTFFYSLFLIFWALILKYVKYKKKRYLFFIYLLAIVLGGGDFVIALVNSILLVLLMIVLIFKKNKLLKPNIITCILFFGSFIISIIAPGNSVRQSMCAKLTPMTAIIASYKNGFNYLFNWINFPVILMIIFLIPFIIHSLKYVKFRFKYPLIITILTFSIFCANFTAPLYATNYIAMRILDIINYQFYWLIIINEIYYIGWLYTKIKEFCDNDVLEKVLDKLFLYVPVFSLVIFLLLVFYSYSENRYLNYCTANAIISLKSGEAQRYNEEMKQRLNIYNNSKNKSITVKTIKNRPKLLYLNDVSEDEKNYINLSVCDYYKIKSIKLVK